MLQLRRLSEWALKSVDQYNQSKYIVGLLNCMASTVEQIMQQASIHAHSSYYNCVTISKECSASKT